MEETLQKEYFFQVLVNYINFLSQLLFVRSWNKVLISLFHFILSLFLRSVFLSF